MGEIYKITNLVNGKCYIGKTKFTSLIRWKAHINGRSPSSLIYKAIAKYGVEHFSFEVLESNVPEKVLNEREMFNIKAFNSKVPNGYNKTDGGDGCNGFVASQEWRYKQSIVHKGKPWSDKRRKAGQKKLLGNNNAGKAVVMLSKDGETVIATYKSSVEASKLTGIGRTAINKAANHTLKTAGGYKWEFLERTCDI